MRKEKSNGVQSTVIKADESVFKEPNYDVRSDLMIRIEKKISALGLTQKQAAKRMGVNQPRVSNLINGNIDRFTIDSLVNMLSSLGERIHVISESEKQSFERPMVFNLNTNALRTLKIEKEPELASYEKRPASIHTKFITGDQSSMQNRLAQ